MAKPIAPLALAVSVLSSAVPSAIAQPNNRWICRVAAGSFGPSPYRSRIEEILGSPPQSSPMTPVSGPVTSNFGWRTHPIYGTSNFHTGIDIAAAEGTPIYSSEAGTVEAANDGGAIGLQVVLNHGLHKTIYGHMSQLAVAPGQSVQRGDAIGYVGSTGTSTGPHLHFTVYERLPDGWGRVDPAAYLAQPSSQTDCQTITQQ
ncbi:MAG: M23 family metallopeptidase [Cyanobacteria bacterium P01_G01_bin.4]